MHFLIDADSVIYKAGCANETSWWEIIDNEWDQVVGTAQYKADAIEMIDNDFQSYSLNKEKEAGPLSHALSNAKSLLERIVSHPKCSSYNVYISGKDNYRKRLYKHYKANRDSFSKPLQEQDIRDYLVSVWNAEVSQGQEVDDDIGIALTQDPENNVCVSIDKDLDNVPGWHYNYDKEEFYHIREDEARFKFYCQLLSGDSVDNIPGLRRIGPSKAAKMLQGIDNDIDLCYTCWEHYKDWGHGYDYFLMNARLLWIRQEVGEKWQPCVNLQ